MRIPSLAVTLVFGAPGFAMQMYGLINGRFLWGVLGSVLLCVGLARYIAKKGYHPAWGLWGFAPIMGVLLLLIQWPREELEKAGLASVQKDPNSVLGGRILLAVMAPVGVGIMFVSGLFLGDDGEWLKSVVASISATGDEKTEGDSKAETKSADDRSGEGEGPSEADDSKQESGKDTSADDSAKPEESEKNKGTEAPAKESWPERIRNGMSFDEVTKLAGKSGETVAGGPYGNRITRWKTESGRDVLVRFHNNIVERMSASSPESEDGGKKPPVEIDDAVAQVLDAPKSEESAASKAIGAKDSEGVEGAGRRRDEAAAAEETPRKKVVRVDNTPEPAARSTFRKAVFPEFSDAIPVGPHEIVLHNPGSSDVRAAVRLGRKGKDVTVPAHGAMTVHVFNGRYDVYFLKREAPERLCEAGAVQVQSPPDAVHVQLEESVESVGKPSLPKGPR